MSNKLNLSAVERYSKAFAAKVCNDFFAEHSTITGKQILSLTSLKQVNMLTVKALFDKWQADTQRLRSPYFDFSASEVQQALQNFMNTVSQHISIKREHFEPLLVDSVGETLVLILEPQTFYKELMRDLPSFKFSQENIRPLIKYILINKDILPKIAEKLNGQEFVFANQAMIWLEETSLSFESSEKYLAQFTEIISLPEELLPITQTMKVAETGISFFDFAVPKLESLSTEFGTQATPIIDEPMVASLVNDEMTAVQIVPKETENMRLNEKLASEQKSINDQIQSSKSVLDHHQSTRIEGITTAISLNQRFLFTNNLFGGNIQAFSHALEELELCKDFSEAKELILKKYVPRYMWDITGAEAEEFIEIMKRRFN